MRPTENTPFKKDFDALLERLSWLIPRRRATFRHYVYALTLTALALVARFLIAPVNGGIQYVTFFPIVAISAVLGGLGPGLLAAGLGATLATYFFWPPYGTFVFGFSREVIISNTVFLFDGVLVCTAIEAMHRFYRRVADAGNALQLGASVFKSSSEGILVTDAAGTIEAVNPAFSDITGYSKDEVIGRKPNMLRSDRHDHDFYRSMWEAINKDGCWQGELWNRRKDGEAFLEWLTINRVVDEEGKTHRYVGVFHDITELRRKDEHIRHIAFHDGLTGLPNRVLFQDRLTHALVRAKREGQRLSVTFLDLDHFKEINDGLGHDVGDLLLQEVASRIRQRLRSMDTAARMGGDEFVILMEDINHPEDCANLAEQLISEISQPMKLGEHSVDVGVSMGMAFYPEDGSDALELMKRADLAMYAAKTAGRSTYRFFQQQMLDDAVWRLAREVELRHAIANQELELHYQPLVALATEKPVAVEALVRWRHPTLGLVAAGQFIPLAEESNLINGIGEWVLRQAFQQMAAWRARGLDIRIAVNLSAKQLDEDALPNRISALADEYGVAPETLEIEVTESAVMADPEVVIGVLTRLRGLGVTIAVDDFGSGYSSLAYLRRLPIDVLKIDRSFVNEVDINEEDEQIVRTIMTLGKTLKLTVIAEGVETPRQAELLQAVGCKFAQGYYFSKALPAMELETWLAARR